MSNQGVRGFYQITDTIKTELLKNIDVVFHQAANNDTLFEDKEEMFSANVHSPIELFKRLYKTGCKKFIYEFSQERHLNFSTGATLKFSVSY